MRIIHVDIRKKWDKKKTEIRIGRCAITKGDYSDGDNNGVDDGDSDDKAGDEDDDEEDDNEDDDDDVDDDYAYDHDDDNDDWPNEDCSFLW